LKDKLISAQTYCNCRRPSCSRVIGEVYTGCRETGPTSFLL